ncbi:MAG TPA: thioesterase family protein [Terriglobia bacterium]|nr:thioesterase family protein [Terriglobia bacterium]
MAEPHTSESRFRVRYAETDQMGVVYYANYLVWMEVGRTDYCKSLGFDYRDMESEGAFMAVAEASCRYIAPAVYDNLIVVKTWLEKVNRKIVTFAYTISNGDTGQVLAEGRTVHLTMGRDKKSRALPARYFEIMAKAM